jgi:Glyoxalase-like domain
MEIDHIFMFIEPDGPELNQLKSLGLVETYRREHPGQGTANACFCFDNMFVELLWMVDPTEALSTLIVRTDLEPITMENRWDVSVWHCLARWRR